MWRDGASAESDLLPQDTGPGWYPSHMLKHEAVPVNSVKDVCVCVCVCDAVNCCNVVRNVSDSTSSGNDEVSGGEQSTKPVVTSVPSSFVTSVPNTVLEAAAEIGPENVGMRWEREASGTDSVSDIVAMKGRLKDCISFWKDAPCSGVARGGLGGQLPPLFSRTTS